MSHSLVYLEGDCVEVLLPYPLHYFRPEQGGGAPGKNQSSSLSWRGRKARKNPQEIVEFKESKSPETATYRELFVVADYESRPAFVKAARLLPSSSVLHLHSA
ncbi:unnamed protein product [Cuscuta europaea]|uniref:Uncharacterized protein n=1 Tax=Cuscuta europaea TaxID=41803 RepID=A0A9P0ZDX4_CUSEU|nr:unnamed protein product [Cuscuta europaea]